MFTICKEGLVTKNAQRAIGVYVMCTRILCCTTRQISYVLNATMEAKFKVIIPWKHPNIRCDSLLWFRKNLRDAGPYATTTGGGAAAASVLQWNRVASLRHGARIR